MHLYRVVIDIDPRIVVASEEHQADLIREFQLIALGASQADDAAAIPGRLADLIVEILSDYTGVQEENLARATAAVERGDEVVSLEMLLPAEVIPAIERIRDALEEADAYCRRGEGLLTLAAPPEITAARRWFVEEITRQISAAQASHRTL